MNKVLLNGAMSLLSLSVVFASAVVQGKEAAGERVIAGSDGAVLTIEEFADFECSYCVRGAATMGQLLKDYDGKIKLVFRNLPLDFHPNALKAAKAFSAVWLQQPSSAYEFYSKVFANQGRLENEGEAFLFETAKNLGIDLAQLKSDMNGPEVAKILKEDKELADLHKFRGTPSFRIGNENVSGALPLAEFKKIVDRQLAQVK